MEKEDRVLPESRNGGICGSCQNTTADRTSHMEDQVPVLLEDEEGDQEQIQACIDQYLEDLIDFQVDVILGYKEQRWIGCCVLKVRSGCGV